MDAQFPVASTLLAVACVLLHVTQREVPKTSQPPPLRRMTSDTLSFSGIAVASHKWWVWFTATLHHGGRSHVVNNVAMLMVLSPAIEARVGPVWLTVLFFGIGAAGWGATYLYTRFVHAEMWSIGVAQYLSGRGSSPATYGFAVLAILMLPVGTATGGNGVRCDAGGRGTIVGTAFGLPQWVWVASVVVLPFFCSPGYSVDLFSGAKPRSPTPGTTSVAESSASVDANAPAGLRKRTADGAPSPPVAAPDPVTPKGLGTVTKWALLALGYGAVWAAFAAGARLTGRDPASFMDAGVFAVVYFGKVFSLKLYYAVARPHAPGTSDDSAHMGGAVAGAVVGLAWQALSSGSPSGIVACATLSRLGYVVGSLGYLAAAVALRKD